MSLSILTRLKNKDKEALKELFDQFYSDLTRFAARLIADPLTAEEIVQDVFIYIWEKRDSLHISVSFEAYLYRAVKNKCINHVKSKTFRINKDLVSQEKILDIEAPEPDLEALELRGLIEKALSNLPSQTAGIFSFSRNAGLSHAEIAKKLNISPKTVEYHISSALRFLRSFLSRYGYILPPVLFQAL